MTESNKQNLAIPIAIVVAGALVAGAIFFMEQGRPLTGLPSAANPAAGTVAKNVPPVTAADHIIGSPDAPVKIVEYTDLECPFCKQFHNTMKQVVADYPGKVAWVIRNFPLQQLHPNAPKLALAAECVASLGGNDAYWKFSDSIIAQAPITEQDTPQGKVITNSTFFDMTKLDATAVAAGVNAKAFDDCVSSSKFQDLVTQQFNDATAAGGQGTPFSILIKADGTQVPVSGSQPLAVIESTIKAALK